MEAERLGKALGVEELRAAEADLREFMAARAVWPQFYSRSQQQQSEQLCAIDRPLVQECNQRNAKCLATIDCWIAVAAMALASKPVQAMNPIA